MFSCCCAVGWDTVCNCHTGGNTCSASCLGQRMTAGDMYIYAAEDLYNRIRAQYPTSEIWVTGHSLGGSLASTLAAKRNLAAFTYGAPGDLLYAQRIGLNIDTANMQNYRMFPPPLLSFAFGDETQFITTKKINNN